MTIPSTTRIAVIRKLWRKIGSEKICFQLSVPTQCGEPIASHEVSDSQHDHAQRHDRKQREVRDRGQ